MLLKIIVKLSHNQKYLQFQNIVDPFRLLIKVVQLQVCNLCKPICKM